MKTLAVVFACILLMAGCASTYTVGSKGSGADYDLEELNRRIQTKECTVVLANGEEKKVKEIICAKDSASWIISARISAARSQISQIQRSSGRTEAVVTFTNGQTTVAEEVIVTNDSVSWMGSTRCWIPTSSLSAVRFKDAGAGAVHGLLPGALIGMSAGLVLLRGLNEAFGGGTIPAQGYLALGGGGAAGGSLLGVLIGAMIGHTEEFRLQGR